MAGKTNAATMTSSTLEPRLLDITAEVCPMTFVRTRLALDRLPSGGLLRVRLRGDEPRRSVPENAAMLGHKVLRVDDHADGTTDILLRHA